MLSRIFRSRRRPKYHPGPGISFGRYEAFPAPESCSIAADSAALEEEKLEFQKLHYKQLCADMATAREQYEVAQARLQRLAEQMMRGRP